MMASLRATGFPSANLSLAMLTYGLIFLGGCNEDGNSEELMEVRGPDELGWKCGDKKCDLARGEDCTICEQDCGRCNGCQEMSNEGCPDARCETCVCKKRPACCKRGHRWDNKCVAVCKEQCGGCGRKPGIEHLSTVTVCKNCDGCRVRKSGGCAGCKCEPCVCKKLPSCCGKNGRWGKKCVAACREQCRGCGIKHAGDAKDHRSLGSGMTGDRGCRCHAAMGGPPTK